MADWTPSTVEARLAEAAWVLKHMPEPRLSGYFSTWPEIVQSFADKVEQECESCGLTRHDPDAVHCKHCAATMHIKTGGLA